MAGDLIAAIMAGGEGKRFRPLTYYIPKPMIPVGRSEKPILEFILRWLYRAGVREAVVLAGYRWRQIVNYFGDGARLGVRLSYVVDREPYTNTGGALARALELGAFAGYRDIIVWYGDILAPLDVGSLTAAHRKCDCDATVAIASSYRIPVGVVETDNSGRVTRMVEKPVIDVKATIGVFMFKSKSIEEIVDLKVLGTSFDIAGDLIPHMVESGLRVQGFLHEGPWYDVGSLERYEKIDHDSIEKILLVDPAVPRYVNL